MTHHRNAGAALHYLLRQRIFRFALVGAVGVPANVGLLWLLHSWLRLETVAAWILAFECTALLNFYANQRFTYQDQTHVRGFEWIRRGIRAQLSSILAVLVNVSVFGLLIAAGMHYLEADVFGIVTAFSANFVIASRLVYTSPEAGGNVLEVAVEEALGAGGTQAAIGGYISGGAGAAAFEPARQMGHGQ